MITALFFASFFQVFLLGLGSQFCRNLWIGMAFANSWLINVAQFAYTRIVANYDHADAVWYFFSAGWGSSLGIVASIIVYRKFFLHKTSAATQ